MEARREAVEHGQGGEVLAGDHLQTLALPILLLQDEAVDLRVGDGEWIVQGPRGLGSSVGNRHLEAETTNAHQAKIQQPSCECTSQETYTNLMILKLI